MKKRGGSILAGVMIFCVWEYFGHASITMRLLLSSPSLVATYFMNNSEPLLTASFYTFVESILGLTVAIAFTFLIMCICFYFPKLLQIVLPTMVISQVIPLISLAPLFIMVLGLGITSKMAMAVLLCFFPLFVSFASGYVAIPRSVNELMYIYAAPRWFRILHVNIPLSLPSIFAGLKISATLSVIGSIVAEFNGAEYGLGKNLFLAAKRLDPELMIASIIISSTIGGFLYGVVTALEKRIGRWYLA